MPVSVSQSQVPGSPGREGGVVTLNCLRQLLSVKGISLEKDRYELLTVITHRRWRIDASATASLPQKPWGWSLSYALATGLGHREGLENNCV